MNKITVSQLQNKLNERINDVSAEIDALKAVKINTSHKTLTNRAIENGTIGDYLSIGKALFISYQSDYRYQTTTINAYSYEDENGQELGSDGFRRISRTITPLELKASLDQVIGYRENDLAGYKNDLKRAESIVFEHNNIVDRAEKLSNGVTWATRSLLN